MESGASTGRAPARACRARARFGWPRQSRSRWGDGAAPVAPAAKAQAPRVGDQPAAPGPARPPGPELGGTKRGHDNSLDQAPNGHIPSRGGVRSNPSRAAYVDPSLLLRARALEIESPGIFIWAHVVSFFACGRDSHGCREKLSRQPDRRAGHEARFFTVVPGYYQLEPLVCDSKATARTH